MRSNWLPGYDRSAMIPDRRDELLRGPAKARRASPFSSPERRAISRHAEEALFESAEILVEGSLDETSEEARFYGSVMISVPFEALDASLRGLDDASIRAQFVQCCEGSMRIRLRAMRLACAEVQRRLPGRETGTAMVETKIAASSDELHIDVDVEVPFGLSYSATRHR